MNPAIQHHRSACAARARQRRDLVPAVGRHVIGICVVIGIAVLLDKAAERIDTSGIGGDRDVIGPARQRRAVEPDVFRGLVDVMIGAIDAALAVTADDMQPARPCGGPCHLAARQGQCGAGDPAAWRARRCWTVGNALGLFVRRDVMRGIAAQARERLGRGGRLWQRRVLSMLCVGRGCAKCERRGAGQEGSAIHAGTSVRFRDSRLSQHARGWRASGREKTAAPGKSAPANCPRRRQGFEKVL